MFDVKVPGLVERFECDSKAGFLQQHRVDAARQLSELRDGLLEFRLGLVQVGCGCPRSHAEQPQPQGQADQALLGAVVQVAFQAPPLLVARGDDAGARVAQVGELGR